MKSLSGINVTDMNTLLQLSGTTQALTQNTGTLSPTSQVRHPQVQVSCSLRESKRRETGSAGAGTRQNKGGRWAETGGKRSEMRESFKGRRREKNEKHKFLMTF